MTSTRRTSALIYILVIYVMAALTAMARADAPHVEIIRTTSVCTLGAEPGELECTKIYPDGHTEQMTCRSDHGHQICETVDLSAPRIVSSASLSAFPRACRRAVAQAARDRGLEYVLSRSPDSDKRGIEIAHQNQASPAPYITKGSVGDYAYINLRVCTAQAAGAAIDAMLGAMKVR